MTDNDFCTKKFKVELELTPAQLHWIECAVSAVRDKQWNRKYELKQKKAKELATFLEKEYREVAALLSKEMAKLLKEN